MRLNKGEMHVGGTCSYVPQTPWVQNLSIRDNITFGLPFDEAKYRKVGVCVVCLCVCVCIGVFLFACVVVHVQVCVPVCVVAPSSYTCTNIQVKLL
jgi:hypothetical protein